MRFGLPRSRPSSPITGYRRGNSTFGLPSDSDEDSFDEEYDAYESDSTSSISSASSSSSSSSSSSIMALGGRLKKFEPLVSPRRWTPRTADRSIIDNEHDRTCKDHLLLSTRSPEETRQIEETVAAIRLRTRHHDPYEDWEKQTRKDAFRTARKELSSMRDTLESEQTRLASSQYKNLASQHARQLAEVESQLSALRLTQERDENLLREQWKVRDKLLWDRIEKVIQLEEGKVRARLDEQRRRQEAEERKRKEEEMKRRLEEERKKAEAEKRRAAEEMQRKEEEEKRQREEDEKKQKEQEEKAKKDKRGAEENARKKLGGTTPEGDWKVARHSLLGLKDKVMSLIKSNKELKSEWNKYRRQITPKIGQITNDEESINLISSQLHRLLKPAPPSPPHNPAVYTALCSSLAKAILLQAETEVTAEKRSAIPLARVTFNLLSTLETFPEVFWAKLVQRVGGWPVPAVIPETDIDGRKWGTGEKGRGRGGENERWRVMGYRRNENAGGATNNGRSPTPSSANLESASDYVTRVSGVMRVYWEVIKVQLRFPDRAPMGGPFQMPKFWIWMARLADEKALLGTAVAAELIYTALEVLGAEAADIWGHQWVKLLQLIYEGTSAGIYGQANILIGGNTPEGRAARARVQMEVERIVKGEKRA